MATPKKIHFPVGDEVEQPKPALRRSDPLITSIYLLYLEVLVKWLIANVSRAINQNVQPDKIWE
jgi:hypothetical protein